MTDTEKTMAADVLAERGVLTRRAPLRSRSTFTRRTAAVELSLTRDDRLEARAARALASAMPRAATMANVAAPAAPVHKAAPVRSEAYRRAVASLPCAICGAPGYSQAAHANQGKGMGMKACDLTCFPACGPRPGIQGCHAALDQGALFTKAVRRELEPVWAADTQRRLLAMGLVPASLINSISTALQGAPTCDHKEPHQPQGRRG